jgi:hypothetical protein
VPIWASCLLISSNTEFTYAILHGIRVAMFSRTRLSRRRDGAALRSGAQKNPGTVVVSVVVVLGYYLSPLS